MPGVNEGEFDERMGKLHALLHGRLNVWATFDWYRIDGFTLDEDNLDVAAFDE